MYLLICIYSYVSTPVLLEIASEMTQRQDTQETDTTPAGGKELRKQASLRFTFI